MSRIPVITGCAHLCKHISVFTFLLDKIKNGSQYWCKTIKNDLCCRIFYLIFFTKTGHLNRGFVDFLCTLCMQTNTVESAMTKIPPRQFFFIQNCEYIKISHNQNFIELKKCTLWTKS